MGFGAGGFLVVVGLILALAVHTSVSGIDVHTVGWIMTAVGVVLIALTAITLNRGRSARTTSIATGSDGTQTVRETRSDV